MSDTESTETPAENPTSSKRKILNLALVTAVVAGGVVVVNQKLKARRSARIEASLETDSSQS